MLNPVDYLLLSASIGSLLALGLKTFLSEKKAMKRLKNSIISKSKWVTESDRLILNSKETKIKKIYKVALETHDGQDYETFKLMC